MFYFFRRGDSLIRCEVRADWNSEGYELVIDRSGSMVQVERFNAAGELNRRWSEFEGLLIRDGWLGPQPCAE
jgi:hypothetical protein